MDNNDRKWSEQVIKGMINCTVILNTSNIDLSWKNATSLNSWHRYNKRILFENLNYTEINIQFNYNINHLHLCVMIY